MAYKSKDGRFFEITEEEHSHIIRQVNDKGGVTHMTADSVAAMVSKKDDKGNLRDEEEVSKDLIKAGGKLGLELTDEGRKREVI